MRPPAYTPPSKQRQLVLAVVTCVVGFVSAVILFELLLRAFPVRESLEVEPVSHSQPYLRFKPNHDLIYSTPWNFEVLNKIHVNNLGFVNNQDYETSSKTPLLAVIGDSYVEALMVPYEHTLQGRLAARLARQARVYSFGASGSALAQYLAYSEYARKEFKPHGMIVVVVGNDFDESLIEYKSLGGFHYLQESSDGQLELQLVPFSPSLWHSVLRSSALARYLNYNLQLSGLRRRLFGGGNYVGNVAASAEPSRIERSKEAVDYFLRTLPEYAGIAPGKIALLVDGMRPHLYEERILAAAEGSYFAIMRSHILGAAKAKGYIAIDMQPRFIERHERENVRFEWPFDSHWNSAGHEEAAKAVFDSGLIEIAVPSGAFQ